MTPENKKKIYKGVVTSDRMAKTIVVSLARLVKHPKYGKYSLRHKRVKAHDEKSVAKVGDTVLIESCRPLSKDKHFVLISKS